jgi:hypothetical protein
LSEGWICRLSRYGGAHKHSRSGEYGQAVTKVFVSYHGLSPLLVFSFGSDKIHFKILLYGCRVVRDRSSLTISLLHSTTFSKNYATAKYEYPHAPRAFVADDKCSCGTVFLDKRLGGRRSALSTRLAPFTSIALLLT